ncbi:MAG: hypothetical protein LBO66_04925 [Deltaproteobacteria bacterium]|nr:hypothetical protein [Deltaproteobacteria bacterium]
MAAIALQNLKDKVGAAFPREAPKMVEQFLLRHGARTRQMWDLVFELSRLPGEALEIAAKLEKTIGYVDDKMEELWAARPWLHLARLRIPFEEGDRVIASQIARPDISAEEKALWESWKYPSAAELKKIFAEIADPVLSLDAFSLSLVEEAFQYIEKIASLPDDPAPVL